MPTQGVVFNSAATVLLWAAWHYSPPNFYLHLFVSDDTPSVNDGDPVPYTEASGVNYVPLNIPAAWLQSLTFNPPLYQIIGAAFVNVGPLTPGSDTVYGWWIDESYGGSPVGLAAGRFDTPLVLNMAGQSVYFDSFQLPLHDCDTIPFQSTEILDPWLQLPVVTGSPPNNWQYAPLVGDWTYSIGATGGHSGISGVGSAFTTPNPFPGTFQMGLIQDDGVIAQTVYVPAGGYQLAVMAAQRNGGTAQTVQITLGSSTLGTISAWPTNWQLWTSSSFTVGVSDTYTLTLTGQVPGSGDATLFIGHVEIVPWPHL